MRRVVVFMFAVAILASLCPAVVTGQTERDLELILSGVRADSTREDGDTEETQRCVSEIGLLATGLIRFYQTIISSQDVDACNFHPSCSRFTSESIRRYGALRGSLLGADRLQRCHWFSRGQYPGDYPCPDAGGKICDHPVDYSSND